MNFLEETEEASRVGGGAPPAAWEWGILKEGGVAQESKEESSFRQEESGVGLGGKDTTFPHTQSGLAPRRPQVYIPLTFFLSSLGIYEDFNNTETRSDLSELSTQVARWRLQGGRKPGNVDDAIVL